MLTIAIRISFIYWIVMNCGMGRAECEIWQEHQKDEAISLLERVGQKAVFCRVANVAVLGSRIYT